MADIAVAHPDLSMRGGAENVCMHVLQALQSDHDLTLLTLTRPDFGSLNDYYRTDVRAPRVRIAGTLAPTLRTRAGHRLSRLQAAIFGRWLQHREREYDLVVSTKNEFPLSGPAVQFVHTPQFAAADPGLDETGLVGRVYRRACARLAGVETGVFDSTRLLANSQWTATEVATAYDADADPVYPPVQVTGVPDRSWAERERGFLTVGRVGPSKRVLRNVEIVSRVRDRGHDVHLHIVGPTTDGAYARTVQSAAADHEYVSLDGAVSRDRLLEMIANHRYGLHGRPYEHFGIVVAEFVAGGAIPFAPDSGGQVEILADTPSLLYESVDDAVATIDAVLSAPERQARLRETLDAITRTFSRDRFEADIADVVGEVLS